MDTNFDKYYSNLWSTCKDYKILEAAGYIKEPIPIEVYCPIPTLTKDDSILILTGCFAPVHEGHIESILLAKREVEKLGLNVKLGLLGLCHDNYVKTKTDNYPLLKRIEEINEKTKKYEWIKPYLWEAYQNDAMNFTSVIESIKRQTEAKVIFVYGSDNFNFRLAFLNNDINICVKRNAKEKFERYLPKIKTNTIYIENSLTKSISSSVIRDDRKLFKID